MNRQLYLERRAEFPHELRELADSNPVIADTIQSYAYGSIVFLDEALARIAILLARQFDNEARIAKGLKARGGSIAFMDAGFNFVKPQVGHPPTQEEIAKMPISENKPH